MASTPPREPRSSAARIGGAAVLVVLLALAARLGAAHVVDRLARDRGAICLFGDARIYWHLAGTILRGEPYVVPQYDVPHFALRTPGYPLFLAGCRRVLGDATLGPRLVQAGLGAAAVALLMILVARLAAGRPERDRRRAVLAAGLLAAVEPWTVGLSALLLSEALFVPMLVLGLLLLDVVVGRLRAGRRWGGVAVAAGLVQGLTVLVRPSWAALAPLVVLAPLLAAGRGRRGRGLASALVMALAASAVMMPWWARNARVVGRFVPTALWLGASLYDGLGPQADGSSDMRFLDDPAIRAMGEVEQDAYLRDQSIMLARHDPARVLRLAGAKAGKFWSPWPQAEGFDAPQVVVAATLVTLPLYALILWGAWRSRRDGRALALLAGPLVGVALLHLVFVGSIRYRAAAMVPALGLAGLAFAGRARRGEAVAPVPDPTPMPPEPEPPRRRRRLPRLVAWSLVFVAAVLAGAVGFAYTYITDSDTLVALVNTQLPTYLPGARLQAQKAQLRPLIGTFDLRQVEVTQPVDGRPFVVAQLPWLQVRCDLDALWRGQVRPHEVRVAQPVLRLTRRRDGRWNLQGLLADPWPHTLQIRPVVRISKGVVELADPAGASKLLRDVELTIEPDPAAPEVDGVFRFEGTALGESVERVALAGTVRTRDGLVQLERGDVTGLALTDALRRRLPPDWRAAWDAVGLTAGRLDLAVERLAFGGPLAAPRYATRLALRDGAWKHDAVPFPLSEVAASGRLADGRLALAWAGGRFGRTRVVVRPSTLGLDPAAGGVGPCELDLSVYDLELDARIRDRLPADWRAAWDGLAPTTGELGRVAVHARLGRPDAATPPACELTVDLLDVAVCPAAFPFPLEHLQGRVALRGRRLSVEEVRAQVGGRPLVIDGTIDDPGGGTAVALKLTAGALPVDEDGPLARALPAELKKIVTSFHPGGTARAVATLVRPAGPPPPGDPWAGLVLRATLDLNDDCSIRWDGLPYPVRRLTGRLALDPAGCTFTGMAGENGVARLSASGRVDALGPDRYAADVTLHADSLPFDEQLRDALPSAWRAGWRLLNPAGTCALDARVTAGYPGADRPDRTWMLIAVGRGDEARATLALEPAPGTPDAPPGRPIALPAMQEVVGRFEFDNGLVRLHDIAFGFRGAAVSVRSGAVLVRDSGQFDLAVQGLHARRLRLDGELRRVMPPRLAQFARHLGEDDPLDVRGDLAIAWSGRADEPAVCSWSGAEVLIQDAAVVAGVPFTHIQGRVHGVSGRSDGRDLSFTGRLDLDSLVVSDVQVSDVGTTIAVAEGRATLSGLQATVLGGTLRGQLEMSLAETPEYKGWAQLEGADLRQLAASIPGRQELAGRLSARVDLTGTGTDLRRLTGSGDARLVEGDLGKLPWFLKILAPLNRPGGPAGPVVGPGKRPAFDAADVRFVVKDGEVVLDPIRITGDAISLHGDGVIKPPGDLSLRFTPLYGRDERFHVRGVSDAAREATGQVMLISAEGPIASPQVGVELLPGPSRRAAEILRRLTDRSPRTAPAPRDPQAVRTRR